MTDSIQKDKDAGGHGSDRRGFMDAMRGPDFWRRQAARHRVRDAKNALARFKGWYYPMVRSEHLAKGPAPLDLKDKPAAVWGAEARGKVPQKKRTPNNEVEPLRTGTPWRTRMGARQANEAQAARWLENFGGSSAKDPPPKHDPGADESIRQAHQVARGNYAPNLSVLPLASGANTVSHLAAPMYQASLRIKKLRDQLTKAKDALGHGSNSDDDDDCPFCGAARAARASYEDAIERAKLNSPSYAASRGKRWGPGQ